jgi:hypothetical protein
MAGLAERYWRDLRPSTAGRYRLDVSARYDREGTGRGGADRDLRRPRRHVRSALRTRSR